MSTRVSRPQFPVILLLNWRLRIASIFSKQDSPIVDLTSSVSLLLFPFIFQQTKLIDERDFELFIRQRKRVLCNPIVVIKKGKKEKKVRAS